MYETSESAIADIESIKLDISKSFSGGRELALVLTKLDEAMLWLNRVK